MPSNNFASDQTNRSLAFVVGGESYTRSPLRAVVGVSLTFSQLDDYTAAIIAAHEAGRPTSEPWSHAALQHLTTVAEQVLRDMQAKDQMVEWQTVLEESIAAGQKALRQASQASQDSQEPVATIEHTVGGSLSYSPIAKAAYRLPMGVEFSLYTEPQPAAVAPSQQETCPDVGPWQVGNWSDNKVVLQSEQFKHDVALVVNGDFATPEDKRVYAESFCKWLNEAAGNPPVAGVPPEK